MIIPALRVDEGEPKSENAHLSSQYQDEASPLSQTITLVDDDTIGKRHDGYTLESKVGGAQPNPIDYKHLTYIAERIESGELGSPDVAETLVGADSITANATRDGTKDTGINLPTMTDNENIAISTSNLLTKIAIASGLNPATDLLNRAPDPSPQPQPASFGGGGKSWFSGSPKPQVALTPDRDMGFQIHRASDLFQNHGDKIAGIAANNPDLQGHIDNLKTNIDQAGKNDKSVSEAIKSLGELMGKLFEKIASKFMKSGNAP